MRDSEVVAAVAAGDPAGLADAYDRYAAPVYAYCRTLLTEPADAADAVQDTFVIAAAKLPGLRDPDRLRSWLYAVARNECHRRLRGQRRSAPLEEAGEVTDGAPAPAETAERAELRALVAAAMAGLNPGDREVLELNLRHDLMGADLAGVLGVPLNQAHALASRARAQFESSLGALLVARGGGESCPDLAALLAGWDGQLTPLTRKRLNRHIERCEVCGERRRRELRPAALLSMLPLVTLPPGLRDQMLRLVADPTPAGQAYRAGVLARAGRFQRSGFPVSQDPPLPMLARHPWQAAGIAAMCALVAGSVSAAVLFHGGGATPMAVRGPAGASGTPAAATASPSASGSATVTASATPSPHATPTATPTLTATASPTPTVTATPTASPAPTPTATPGTLALSSTSVTLTPQAGAAGESGSFTVTATGGPVSPFTITVPSRYAAAGLSVSPASGSLAPGQTVTITVTWASASGVSVNLPVSPGNQQVTVTYQPIT